MRPRRPQAGLDRASWLALVLFGCVALWLGAVTVAPTGLPLSAAAAPTPTPTPTPTPILPPLAPERRARLDARPEGYDPRWGPHTGDRVVLTFDDCPTSHGAFLDTIQAAERLGISLVLFPTGNCIQEGNFVTEEALAHGHFVGNHSNTHAKLTRLSAGGVRKQLGEPGPQSTFGRPPYGAVNDAVKAIYAEKGMQVWLWTLDTNDWRGKTTDEVVDFVLTEAQAGDTVLMHMQWKAFNAGALERITSGLFDVGLEVCPNQGPVTLTSTFAC